MYRFLLGVSLTIASLAILGCGSNDTNVASPESEAAAQGGAEPAAPASIPNDPAPPPLPNRTERNASGLPITISRETTHITQPLREDGYPDYIAAMDERQSRGATATNNYAVALAQVFGPKDIKEAIRATYFEKLGVEPLPEEGDYLISFQDYLKVEYPFLEEELKQRYYDGNFESQPWTKDDFPELAEWHQRHAGHLDRVCPSPQHQTLYTPYIAESPKSSAVLVMMPVTINQGRQASRSLLERAMLRLGEGDLDAAWSDVLACRRMARLAAQGPVLVDILVGEAIDGIAHPAIITIADDPRLTKLQAMRYRREISSFPPRRDILSAMEPGERFVGLDVIAGMIRQGPSSLHGLAWVAEGGMDDIFAKMTESLLNEESGGDPIKAATEEMIKQLTPDEKRKRQLKLLYDAIDWDVVLITCNAYYDRLQEIGKIGDRDQRDTELQKLTAEYEKYGDLTALAELPKGIPAEQRQEFSRRLGGRFMNLISPAVSAAIQAHERTITQDRQAEVALALALWRIENGSYPETLDALVPDHLHDFPHDAFSNAPLRYVRQNDGYLLYSIGHNREDEQGSGPYTDGVGDDITVVVGAE